MPGKCFPASCQSSVPPPVQYRKISQDPDLTRSFTCRKGRCLDSNGIPLHGIYLKDFKETTLKRYIRNGNILASFRYPKIIPTFQSPLVNDYNQHLCGGWCWGHREDGVLRAAFENDSDIILQRVVAGKKPLGGLVGWGDDLRKISRWKKEIAGAELALQVYRNDTKYTLVICRKGLLDKMVDFDRITDDYIAFERNNRRRIFVSSSTIKEFFDFLRQETLEELLRYNFLNSVSKFGLLATGLILGYPIENTYAVLGERGVEEKN